MAMSNSYVKLPAGISKKGVPCLDQKKVNRVAATRLRFRIDSVPKNVLA